MFCKENLFKVFLVFNIILLSSTCAYTDPHGDKEEKFITSKVINGELKQVVNHKKIINLQDARNRGLMGKGIKLGGIEQSFDYWGDTEEALSDSTLEAAPPKESPEAKALQEAAASNHSNHVLSIIAGEDGIAPEATIKYINIHKDPSTQRETTYDDKLAAAIYQCMISDVRFINLSIALVSGSREEREISDTVKQALYTARDAGIGIINSAGNDTEVIGSRAYTSSLSKLLEDMNGSMYAIVNTTYFKTPLKVTKEYLKGNSNKAGEASKYTLAAPGSAILANGAKSSPLVKSGTSMSAPTVTGAACLIAEYINKLNPTTKVTGAEVLDILARSARKTALQGDLLDPNVFGQGVIDVKAALDLIDKEHGVTPTTSQASVQEKSEGSSTVEDLPLDESMIIFS